MTRDPGTAESLRAGKQPHGDACLTDECILYVTVSGKMDMKLADART